ncbi:hypothetical protein [Paraburkholderia fungorum]|uniref:hypothetical protein n=1 Tax=Paraburkholderia fungorum TaxID=134537 RepID=UPI0011C46D47|nr:hypothetical protein [Paraburkholderia fungorum]
MSGVLVASIAVAAIAACWSLLRFTFGLLKPQPMLVETVALSRDVQPELHAFVDDMVTQAHPVDTHPPLSQRLDNPGTSLDAADVSDIALPIESSIDLVRIPEEIEKTALGARGTMARGHSRCGRSPNRISQSKNVSGRAWCDCRRANLRSGPSAARGWLYRTGRASTGAGR